VSLREVMWGVGAHNQVTEDPEWSINHPVQPPFYGTQESGGMYSRESIKGFLGRREQHPYRSRNGGTSLYLSSEASGRKGLCLNRTRRLEADHPI
jgi:hypothetical protein